MQGVIHIANLLVLLSFVVRDVLWLRCISVLASSSFILYFAFGPSPQREPLIWNVLFALLNLFQVGRILSERRPVRMQESEHALYALAFGGLTPRQFLRLAKVGAWREVRAGEELIAQGESLGCLMVLAEGALSVEVDGRVVAELCPGRLVGEMSFLSGAKTTARVIALRSSRYLCWAHPTLRGLLTSDAELRVGLQGVISRDLIAKLGTR